MADIAQILGVADKKPASAEAINTTTAPAPPVPVNAQPSRATLKLQGKSREVLGLLQAKEASSDTKNRSELLQSAPLPPVVPAFPLQKQRLIAHPGEEGAVKVGNRWIKTQVPARKWAWAPFSSSSRTDGTLFHHWVRAGVEYPDYPYARFDIHLDPVAYTDQEYQAHLVSDTWTKSETDRLMELARRLELRWSVIYDRWMEMYALDQTTKDEKDDDVPPPPPERKIEDLQFRFYQVAAILNQVAIQMEATNEAQMLANAAPDPASEDLKTATEHLLYETAAARQLASMERSQQPLITCTGTGTSNKVFDLEYERQRRSYLEAQWNRTREEEQEERELRQELKQVEAQLRKIKKSGGHIWAARKSGGGVGGSASSSRANSRSVSPVPDAVLGAGANAASHADALDEAFSSTAPIPVPGTPYLQSARLVPPAAGGPTGLNKTLLNRMDAVLQELKVPSQPLPTKRVCDMYDSVRKDVIALLLLQKNVLQKEGLLQSKRLRLQKLTGTALVTEETVMGIAPPAPAPVAAAPSAAVGRPKSVTKGTGATKSKNSKKAAVAAAASATEDTPGKDTTAKQGAKQVVGGKQSAGGKQAGGKQGKKAATKRKRKAEGGKSPLPTGAAGKGDTSQPTAAPGAAEPKTTGKKRPRKTDKT